MSGERVKGGRTPYSCRAWATPLWRRRCSLWQPCAGARCSVRSSAASSRASPQPGVLVLTLVAMLLSLATLVVIIVES